MWQVSLIALSQHEEDEPEGDATYEDEGTRNNTAPVPASVVPGSVAQAAMVDTHDMLAHGNVGSHRVSDLWLVRPGPLSCFRVPFP